MRYVDKFRQIPSDAQLSEYFHLGYQAPSNWSIDLSRILCSIGVKRNTSNTNDNFTIQIRGDKESFEDNKLIIYLGHILEIMQHFELLIQMKELLVKCDEIHYEIEEYFKQLMTENLKAILGYQE